MKEEIIRNQTRFPIPPGHLVHAIRHPIPDNDITFRGFSVGISPIIYPAQSGVALSRCNIRSWRGSTRPSMKRSRASVVTFPLYFIPSLPSSELSALLERGWAIFIESDVDVFVLLRRIGFVRDNIAMRLGKLSATDRVKREISSWDER